MTESHKEGKQEKRNERFRFNIFILLKKNDSLGSAMGGGWVNVLAPYILHPKENNVYYYDKETVVIEDKYPKARYHYLVMPAQLKDGFSSLTPEDLPMLNQLKTRGNLLVAELQKKAQTKIPFKMGFHAIPSLRQIHMHVISQDMESESMKTKKHWNSFTTEFFINVDEMIATLKYEGKISFDKSKYEELLKKDLRCHRCGDAFINIPKLKSHLTTCKK